MYLASVFSDNMVLQRGVRIPVWGWADTGKEVTVKLGDQQRSMAVPDGGYWRVDFDPLQPGEPLELTAGDGGETFTCKNVLVGEVWVCSGQSNMARPLEGADGSKQAIAEAQDQKLRLFQTPVLAAGEPQVDVATAWQVSNPQTAGVFSAVGYHFGRILRHELGIPVGLIQAAQGGTPIHCWISRPVMEANPYCKPSLDRYDYMRSHLALEQKKNAKAQLPGEPVPPPNVGTKQQVSGLFNAMVAPLIPYAIRGAIWYQGESNTDRAYNYRHLLAALIGDWRRRWGQGDFPFISVQLPNYIPAPENAVRPLCWAEFRESQLDAVRKVGNTALAVTIDIGNPRDIHPTNKLAFAERLAKVALHDVYGQNIPAHGPTCDSFAVEGQNIRVRFKNIEGGLKTGNGQAVRGFTLAGADLEFVPAQAAIDGHSVVVSAKNVRQPVALRYAWADNPDCNLYNSADLPAGPFRTDNWPGITDHLR